MASEQAFLALTYTGMVLLALFVAWPCVHTIFFSSKPNVSQPLYKPKYWWLGKLNDFVEARIRKPASRTTSNSNAT